MNTGGDHSLPTPPRETPRAASYRFHPDPVRVSLFIKDTARRLGFDLVGITEPVASPFQDHVRRWIAAGRHGRMSYLEANLESRLDIRKAFPAVRSVVCVAVSYYREEPPFRDAPAEPWGAGRRGRIARYAWGRDYHRVLRAGLIKLERALRDEFSDPFESRIYVDTGPCMERELAARAGLGWIGRNTLLINPRHGSWFVLGELLTSLPADADAPLPDRCGTCTRCLEACPTEALTPYQLDATRCLSYHTLENRGEIPGEFHPPMQLAGYLIGCDICQTVCPYNRRPLPTGDPDFIAAAPAPVVSLDPIAQWSQSDWDSQTRGRAFRRAKLDMWKRNAAILRRSSPEAGPEIGRSENKPLAAPRAGA